MAPTKVALSLQGLLVFALMCCEKVSAFSFRMKQKQEKTIVLLYNKPKHVVTTHSRDDEKGRKNVYDDIFTLRGYVGEKKMPNSVDFQSLAGMTMKLHAIGRLDAETTGLLLLTNDGGLVHHVTASHCVLEEVKPDFTPLSTVTKTYKVLIMGNHVDDDSEGSIFNVLRTQGVDIGSKNGGITRPVENVKMLSNPTVKSTLLLLTISEGKNRQIRRMFHALGSGVMQLQRVQIGDYLTLDGIEDEGKWRILTDEEVCHALNWQPRVLVDKRPRARKTPIKMKSKRSSKPTRRSKGRNRI
mmetsp:Transcript_26103/g.71913  ORF Transcript_26103/g.71913 Transcript_26103/m.71913 type:complete len:299 (+) Transcript_26103:75-971(+)